MTFLATVGCDGDLHLNNIEDLECKRKQNIATKTLNFSAQTLSLKWSMDGSILYAAG